MTLYSVVDGSRGANLTSLIVEAQQRALGLLSRSVELFDDGADRTTKAFRVLESLTEGGTRTDSYFGATEAYAWTKILRRSSR